MLLVRGKKGYSGFAALIFLVFGKIGNGTNFVV